jgi:hypothetical protein
LIFKNKEFYFETEAELRIIYEKLLNPDIRNRWIEEQKAELRYVLDEVMDPMFSFDDYCKEAKNEETKTDLKLASPLF